MDVNLAPQVISRVLGEIRELNKKPADGIEFIDNEENTVSEIHAIITGPEGTPFHRGKFRMKLCLNHDYPASPPRGYFLTKIYHPNVSSNGDICVNTLKKDWSSTTTLKHVLQVIRCLLIVPFPESSLNDEAGKLFMDSYSEFERRARLMTDVHAIDESEENDDEVVENTVQRCSVAATASSSSPSSSSAIITTTLKYDDFQSTASDSLSDDARGGNENSENTEPVKTSSKTGTVKVKQVSKQAQAKKKSMKRL